MVVNWSTVRYFARSEWIKDPDRVNPILVQRMDALRDFLGHPVVIHVAWDDAGHVEDSAHYSGDAVDFAVPGLSLLDAWLAVERFEFWGVGIYPYWHQPGLHVDLRPSLEHPEAGRRWWRDEGGVYRALDHTVVALMVQAAEAGIVVGA